MLIPNRARIPTHLAFLTVATALAPAPAARADTAVFRDGFVTPIIGGGYGGTDDTMLVNNFNGQTDQNFGGRADFEVSGNSTFPRNVLLRFDVSALAHAGSVTVTGVSLNLTNAGAPSGPGTLRVFRLADANAAWVEGTGVAALGGDPADTGMATWNAAIEGSRAWAGSPGASTAGTDYTALLAATAVAPDTNPANSSLDIPLDPAANALVQSWITGGTNAGFFLTVDSATAPGPDFFSSEAPNPSQHPALIVTYSVAVPDPSRVLAFLVLIPACALARRRRHAAA